jgi:hypothetical protein
MDTVLKIPGGEMAQRARSFETQVGDDQFEFHTVAFDDAKVTGAQVCGQASGRGLRRAAAPRDR